MNFILCTSSFVFVVLWQYTSLVIGQQQCGNLNEAQLYNEKPIIAIDEFPWIARLYYRHYETNERLFRCVAVLISKRHLLTAQHCVANNIQYEPEYVLVGDYDSGNQDTEPDCDATNQCTPPPQKYLINDIILHPNYNRHKRINDIAILHLERDVQFNKFVQPICMPPPSMYTANFRAQYFSSSGYLHRNRNPRNITTKIKTVAHVISNIRCTKAFEEFSRIPPQLDTSVICTSFLGENDFLSGSILMAVNIDDMELINFVLLGILSYGGTLQTEDSVQYDVYMRISSYINWIQSNINQPYNKVKNTNLNIWS